MHGLSQCGVDTVLLPSNVVQILRKALTVSVGLITDRDDFGRQMRGYKTEVSLEWRSITIYSRV